MSLQKAQFENLDRKARGEPSTAWRMEVQFNPTDLTFNKTAQFAEIAIPGLDAPVQQFVRGGTETLSLELFFDTTDDGMAKNATSVTTLTDQFYAFVKQDRDTHAPPKCLFVWGPPPLQEAVEIINSFWVSFAPFWFTCIVESIDRKFLLFSPEGIPLRARLTVKLREYQTVEQMVSKLNSADHTKARVFKRKERLDQLSATEYETPAEWRRIAEENEIDNPLKIPPGTILRLPPMPSGSEPRRIQ
ncbi:CIS tube protein [Nostoc sp.]|uniref:CIS tube protein n=1 Tax=Nostoc sp. TaxID=1180 RepID=UPI002FF96E07